MRNLVKLTKFENTFHMDMTIHVVIDPTRGDETLLKEAYQA